jgi:hypothetical protein
MEVLFLVNVRRLESGDVEGNQSEDPKTLALQGLS